MSEVETTDINQVAYLIFRRNPLRDVHHCPNPHRRRHNGRQAEDWGQRIVIWPKSGYAPSYRCARLEDAGIPFVAQSPL